MTGRRLRGGEEHFAAIDLLPPTTFMSSEPLLHVTFEADCTLQQAGAIRLSHLIAGEKGNKLPAIYSVAH